MPFPACDLLWIRKLTPTVIQFAPVTFLRQPKTAATAVILKPHAIVTNKLLKDARITAVISNTAALRDISTEKKTAPKKDLFPASLHVMVIIGANIRNNLV